MEFSSKREAHDDEGVYLLKEMPQKNNWQEKLYEIEQVTKVMMHLEEDTIKMIELPNEAKEQLLETHL